MTAISLLYKGLVRPAVFRLTSKDAEVAHQLGLWTLEQLRQEWLGRWANRHFVYRDDAERPMMQTKAFGLRFPNHYAWQQVSTRKRGSLTS